MSELSLLAWVAVTLLDLSLTHEGVRHGLHEKNPIVRWLIETFGIHLACSIDLVVSGLLGIVLMPWPPILLAASAVRAVVVIHNLIQIHEHNRREKKED